MLIYNFFKVISHRRKYKGQDLYFFLHQCTMVILYGHGTQEPVSFFPPPPSTPLSSSFPLPFFHSGRFPQYNSYPIVLSAVTPLPTKLFVVYYTNINKYSLLCKNHLHTGFITKEISYRCYNVPCIDVKNFINTKQALS